MKYFYFSYTFTSRVKSFDVVALNMAEAYAVAKHLHPEHEPTQIGEHDSPITQTIHFTEAGFEKFKAQIVRVSPAIFSVKPIGEQK